MTARKYEINASEQFYKQEYCGCSFSLRDNNFHRAKEGLDPIKPAQGDVYSDPLMDAAEESPEVVDAFFRDAPAFSDNCVLGRLQDAKAGAGRVRFGE